MKNLRIFIVLLLLPCSLFAQQTISGKVLDKASGEALPGVYVLIKGTTRGTSTDFEGNYTLDDVNVADVLSFSFMGYQIKEVVVASSNTINVELEEGSESLDEVVIVGYGAQKKESVTAAISTVDTKELTISSSPNLAVALAGQLPGLTVMQSSGQPGRDNVNLYLRGIGTLNNSSPLILIDGIPREGISQMDPNEIETISILKDASATAVFGVRGANGVILITTRRGKKGASELNVTVDQSYQQFLVKNDRIHSWEFAELRNEAYLNGNPGALPENMPYTPYMIDKYRSGDDTQWYPDRDVSSEFFREWAPQTRINTNFNGGGDSFNYFLNAGYISQGGNFKTEDEDFLGYDPGFSMNRFNFRANIDYDISSNLKASLNLATYLQKTNSPQSDLLYGGNVDWMVAALVANVWATPPTDPGPYVGVNDQGIALNEVLIQQGTNGSNFGEINRRGYRDETSTVFNSSLGLDYKMDFITEGLSAKLLLAFDSHASTVRQGIRGVDYYNKVVARDASETSRYFLSNPITDKAMNLSKGMATRYYMNFQGSINYDRTFGKHHVTAMGLYQRDNWDGWGPDLPFNVIGYVGRATYGYDNRYMVEFNVGYNGSEQFAPDNRFGTFPAYSVGWVVSNENFLKDNQVITHLKLRASYGITGNDKMGDERFLYQSFITVGGGGFPELGRGQVITQGKMGNESLQWEKAEKKNLGIELNLFKDLSLNVDLYHEYRDQILIGRSTIPILQGVPIANIPKVNLGVVENQGFEVELGYRKRIKEDLSFSLRGNFSYNENNVEFADEVQFGPEYANRFRRTGYSIGQLFGYQIDRSNGNGYINTLEELANLPTYEMGGVPRLGDFIYKDLNNDGFVNDKDLAPIGYTAVPRISYGIAGNVNFKDFDLGFVLAGISKSSVFHVNQGVTEFGPAGFYSEWHKTAWTPERFASGEDITYPALAFSPGVSQAPNDFFIMDRSFLRLKSIELGYNLPANILQPVGMDGVRVYVNGNNLLTWDSMPTGTIDPEQDNALAFPLTKRVSFGVKMSF